MNETQEPGSSKMGTFWSNWSLFDLEVRFVLAGLVEIWSILHKFFLGFRMCSDGSRGHGLCSMWHF